MFTIKCPECGNENVTRIGTDNLSIIYKCGACLVTFRGDTGTLLPGVGPDAPTTTNENGSKQSAFTYRMDLIPPLAILAVAAVLKIGADKYGVDNWRGIPANDHLGHALQHIYAFLAGDVQDNHLGHAATRILMAYEQKLKETEVKENFKAVFYDYRNP